jgi:hypothetical protein
MTGNFKTSVTLCALALAACSGSPAGDATRQLVLYRPANSTFYVRQGDSGQPATEIPFGTTGDMPLWADFDGSGKAEPGLYRKNGDWLISTHADGKADLTFNFGGAPGDIPLAADLDGDGKADLVVFRGGEWHVRMTRNPAVTQVFHFGRGGDVPLLADFDGDGNIDFAVYRNGQWMIDTHRDGKANVTFAFGGVAGDRPLAGRWGSGGAVPMLFRDGTWLVSANRDGKVTAQVAFGGKGDVPLAVRPLR